MPKGHMPGLWLLPENLEKLNWLWTLTKGHWGNGLIPYLVIWFITVFQIKNKGYSPERWHGSKLKALWEPPGLQEYRNNRQSCMTVVGLDFCALNGWLKLSLKVPCKNSSTIYIKIVYNYFMFLCLWKISRQKSSSLFDDNEGNLKEKNTFQKNHRAWLWILDSSADNYLQSFIFTWKLNEVPYLPYNLHQHLTTSPEIFHLQARIICQIVII